jgi:small conductance mechanosensitive channel
MNAPLLVAQASPPVGAPIDVLRQSALKKIRDLQFTALTPEEWLRAGEYYGLRAMFVIVLMILAWTISGWVASAVDRGLQQVKFDETLTRFLAKFARWLILLLVGLTCLSYFGVETTGFAAVIGAAGLAIGLAFQGTLSNFAAGAMLLVFRPYKVGDMVHVAGYLGKVFEIELFTTALDTTDNRRVIVPNSAIFGAVIENVTYHKLRRADIDVGVAYDADIDATRQALERALASAPLVVRDPPPAAVLMDLGASSVNWQVRGWTPTSEYVQARQQLIRAVKIELDRTGIVIPFPQLDVHLRGALPR